MASRRMLDREIVLSDHFRAMPLSAQVAYMYMLVSADDEGFISNAKMLCPGKALKILEENGYILTFPSKVVLLTHWLVHNRIRKDTFRPTKYEEERSMVHVDKTRIYRYGSVTEPLQICADSVPQEREAQQKQAQQLKHRESNASAEQPQEDGSLDIKTDFDVFWECYPNKNGKDRAKTAFDVANAPLEVLLEGLENHKKSRQWLSDGGLFIPTAANWLNGKRWTDRLVEDRVASGRFMQPSCQPGEAELEMVRAIMRAPPE